MSYLEIATVSKPLTEVSQPQHEVDPAQSEHWSVFNSAVVDGNVVTVLIVDDDRVDRMAVRRSFKALKIANPIVEASDGINALDMLRGENGCEKLRRPCLVLLDLHMPRMDGIEFVEEVLGDPELQPMLVFVMTTSSEEEKRARAYVKNVAGYVSKHRPEQSFLTAISMRTHSWRAVERPN